MLDERKRLLLEISNDHQSDLNRQIVRIVFIYLGLSISWNTIFRVLHVHYSRANLSILLICMVVWLALYTVIRLFHEHTYLIKHIVLIYVIFIITCIYFGSGYREAWSYFLLIPMVTGFYGDSILLIGYSLFGVIVLLTVSIQFPIIPRTFDAIDISNRILLYIIVVTFSYLFLKKLNLLHQKQVSTLINSMDTTIEQVVKSFVIAVEAKDHYTFGHSERVSQYAVELAKRMPEFQDERKLHSLRLSGLLHDIGKINIPESILTKPSRLTDEEFEIIKTHPIVGGKMIEKISGLGSLRSGVLYHHERWDGKGYPSRLKGNDIPLEARILAIADAFDAMTSSRAYRKELSTIEAFQRLKDGKGTQFDPYLIDVLETIQLTWIRICKESLDETLEFERLTDLF